MTATVAALFVDPKGPYWGRSDIDAWDESRDARNYRGPLPVVAHPPCSNWSNMAPVVKARRGQDIGADNGCFAAALEAVRTHGGVIEQPAYSRAWNAFGLTRPTGEWLRVPCRFPISYTFKHAWVCQVSQSAYGHLARKRTWLYYIGAVPPFDLDWRSPKGTHVISYCKRRGDGSMWDDPRPRLSKRRASVTPPAFAEALIQLAHNCGGAP